MFNFMKPARTKGQQIPVRFLGELDSGRLVYAVRFDEYSEEEAAEYSRLGIFHKNGQTSTLDLENTGEE
jgi:hypothetical protein